MRLKWATALVGYLILPTVTTPCFSWTKRNNLRTHHATGAVPVVRAVDFRLRPAALQDFSASDGTQERRRRRRKWSWIRHQLGRLKWWGRRRNASSTDELVSPTESWIDHQQSPLPVQPIQILTLPEWASNDLAERRRLAEMKLLLVDDFDSIQNQTVVVRGSTVPVVSAFKDVYGDLRLLRFLRKDKVQNPESGAKRFRKFMRWRQESGADHIRAKLEEEHDLSDDYEVIANLTQSDFRLGHIISPDAGSFPIILHVGDWKTRLIANRMRKGELLLNDFLAYWIFVFETLHRDLYIESHRQEKLVYVDEICDLSRISLGQLSPTFVSRVLEPWVSTTQSNYPETTKRIVFFNPPRILWLAWKVVAQFVSPGTLAKVRLVARPLSSPLDYAQELYEQKTVKHKKLSL